MRLIDADALMETLERGDWVHVTDYNIAIYAVKDAPTVDAIPIDWINLFNSTPIGGDSIDDLLREGRYKQEVEAERKRGEDGNETD